MRGVLQRAGDWALRDVLPALLAVIILLFVSSQAALAQVPPHRALDAAAYVILVLAGLSLVLWRRAPAVLLALEVLLSSIYLAAGYPYGPLPLMASVAAYMVTARSRTRRTIAAAGTAALALVLADLIGNDRSGLHKVVDAVLEAGWVLAPALVGALAYQLRVASVRAEEEAAARRSEQEDLRVAREVHDVVGHGLSVISLQAGVALHVLDRRPEQARPALEAIRATSIEALDQLRMTLAPGRAEGPSPSGLVRLETIIAQVRRSGLSVEVETSGVPRALPANVDAAALRVIQESLTNVLRHAGPATARVQLSYGPRALEVAVSDNGSAGPAEAVAVGSGQGLSGLHQRAEELGGSLETGRGSAGGWWVRAILPTVAGATCGKDESP